MLSWTSKCIMGTFETQGAWRPLTCSDMQQQVAICPFCFLLADGDKFHKFWRNSGFSLTTLSSPAQLELISGHMDCLLEIGVSFGLNELPLDLFLASLSYVNVVSVRWGLPSPCGLTGCPQCM